MPSFASSPLSTAGSTNNTATTSTGLSPFSTIRTHIRSPKETVPLWLRHIIERAPLPPATSPTTPAISFGEGRERDLVKLVQEQQRRLEVLEAENASLRSKADLRAQQHQAFEIERSPTASDHGVSREQLWLLIDDLVEQRRVSEESHREETKALRGAIGFFLKEKERPDAESTVADNHTEEEDHVTARLIADARHAVESDSSGSQNNESDMESSNDEVAGDDQESTSESDRYPTERSSRNLLRHYRSVLLKESRACAPVKMSVSPESHLMGASPDSSVVGRRTSQIPERIATEDESREDQEMEEPTVDEVPFNPNQRGTVVGSSNKNHAFLLVEALKCGIVYEVCKSFREREGEEIDRAERKAEEESARRDAQEVTSELGRIGKLKATLGTLATGGRDALRTTALTMVSGKQKRLRQRANEQLIGETSEYFCHWEHNKVACHRSLPHSLPPLKAHNTDPSILHNFNPDKERSIVGNWDSTRLLDARTDQLRLQFLGPRFFAVLREFLGADLNNLRVAAEHCEWRNSHSPGKSAASLMYFGNYVLKEVKQDIEMRFLKDHFLAPYMAHVRAQPNTILPHFLSVVSVTNLHSRTTTTYVLMRNVISTPNPVSIVYDLKGSVVGRTGVETHTSRFSDVAPLLKDNDLPEDSLVQCGPLKRAELLAQLQVDTAFLRRLHIVDYSLLVGIYKRNMTRSLAVEENATRNTAAKPWEGILSEPLYEPGDANSYREETYFLGIIDVLQPYNSGKQIENFAKGLVQDKHGISIVPPDEFADRLCKLASRLFN